MTQPPPLEGRFLAAARRRGRGRPPLWIMRQAGRYLPEYQALRARHSFVEMCTQPELAVEISLQPYRRFAFDAVVVFYDILFVPEAMGAPLEFTEKGPVFRRAIHSIEDVRELRHPDPRGHTRPVLETIAAVRRELPPEVAVLGFAGAPFTIAAYLVEGEFRRSGDRIQRMLHEEPETLRALLDRITAATIEYLDAQIEAGADAVQLFDTWAGLLGPEEYESFALPYQRRIFESIAARGRAGDPPTPTILYINGCAHLVELMAESGAAVLSVDWRLDLPRLRAELGPDIGLQGNLDPSALFAPVSAVRERAGRLLARFGGDPAWIFNLGHGILPQTPVAAVEALVETVREFDARDFDARNPEAGNVKDLT